MLATIGDIRLFMDADNSTKIDEIAAFAFLNKAMMW